MEERVFFSYFFSPCFITCPKATLKFIFAIIMYAFLNFHCAAMEDVLQARAG